jgi:hypothetical protein
MPFTVDEFLDVFEAYNRAIWPGQIVAYALGIGLILLIFSRPTHANRVISAGLAAMWLWTGIVYHILSFSAINKLAYVFGLVFVLQGILLLVNGVFRDNIRFRARPDLYGMAGGVLVIYSLVYPALGMLLGHVYPRVPMFGVTPCPMTIFTFGFLLWTEDSVSRALLIIPFVWSLIGSLAAVSMGMTEDLGLIVAGLAGSLLILHRERAQTAARMKAAQTSSVD